jgi:DNA-binding IclR family transcriptional regulator
MSPGSTREPDHSIQSVRRALRLIGQLAREKGAVPICQPSRKVDLHVSTTRRLLSTLKLEGLVRQDPASGYHLLGPEPLLLGRQCLTGTARCMAVRAEGVWESKGRVPPRPRG